MDHRNPPEQQGYILKQLSPPVLAKVAVILAEFEKGGAK